MGKVVPSVVVCLVFMLAALPVSAQRGGGVIFEDGFESGDFSAWSSVVIVVPNTVPPLLEILAPVDPLQINEPSPEVVLAFSDADPGVDFASLMVRIDGADITATCSVKAASATCQPPPQASGFHTLDAALADLNGNSATASFDFEVLLDTSAPEITISSPESDALLALPVVLVEGMVTDADEVVRIELAGQAGMLAGDDFTVPAALTAGSNTLTVRAFDRAGNEGTASLSLRLDLVAPSLVIDEPVPGLFTNEATVDVLGFASDDLGLANVTVNGAPATLTDGRFLETVALAEGESTVLVRATDLVGNTRETEIDVTRRTVPEVVITSPQDQSLAGASTLEVAGTVSAEVTTVDVNGVTATVENGTFTASGVAVAEGGNLLVAVAATGSGSEASDKVTVFRDATPPRITVYEPFDGAQVEGASVAVTGLVNDTVLGTVNGGQVTVTVEGQPAQVVNRSFLATSVPLAPGENVLIVEATDASGNLGTAQVRVFSEASAGPRIRKISGDLQQGTIGGLLSEPLVVELLDGAGTPVADRPVVFQVLDNNGFLPGGARRVVVNSGPNGQASSTFALGSRAGVGNQRVMATAPSFLGQAVFLASAEPSAAAQLVIDDGDQQVGTTGRFLPDPLVVVVTDSGFNRLAGVPVRFRVVNGSGVFANGSSAVTVPTDSDGRARALLRLDAQEGIANNIVEADLPGDRTVPFATFVATGWTAGDPAATKVSGVVLDNSDQPVPGATVSIHDTALTAVTDEAGLFEISGAPVGTFFLEIEGDTTTRPGSWPHLEFEMTTIAGRDNTLGMPIYLLPLDDRGLAVSATEGGVLALPELPGFSLAVAPGSVTFPGGGMNGMVSATLVHGDKVPMVPNFGQQPRFIVTIQPAGAVFDPPARLTLPNVDGMAPGEVTEMYSFDHDLASFVSIGPGTVTEDGTAVVSNPGVGILKAGWHCGGNPSSSGTPHDCPTCKICNGSQCVPGCSVLAEGETFSSADGDLLARLAAAGCNCTGNDPCEFDYRCDGSGNCTHTDVEVTGITGGACVAAVGQSITFTAQSNKQDRVKWKSGGNPSTATGGSYSVTFSAEGNETVTAFCKNSQSKDVTVGADCAGITPVLLEPEIAGTTTNFGEVGPGRNRMAKYKECVAGSRWCFRLEEYSESHSFVVNGQGRTDVPNANAPVVTAATCAAIITDLTPPAAGATRGPPRGTYWTQAFTTAHERAHVANVKSMVTDRVFADLTAFVSNASNCTDCKSAIPAARFNMEMNRLFTQYFGAMAPTEEARAHGVSNPMYSSLIGAIRARGRAENWPAACQ